MTIAFLFTIFYLKGMIYDIKSAMSFTKFTQAIDIVSGNEISP